ESCDRTDIGQSRLARERTAAFTAMVQRGADGEALRFDLYRYRLPHVSGCHQADFLDLHGVAFQVIYERETIPRRARPRFLIRSRHIQTWPPGSSPLAALQCNRKMGL